MSTLHYRVRHETHYHYALPVSLSQQLLHLEPRPLARQRLLDWRLDCDPQPTASTRTLDAFGNPVTRLAFEGPHRQLAVVSELRVALEARVHALALSQSAPWETVAEVLRYQGRPLPSPDALEAQRYRFQSPHVPVSSRFGRYAAACFELGRPLLDGARDLMRLLHTELRFDPDATHIATPLVEVLERRRGVCQDYAHLMIACLRAHGLPARYVSGYLLTTPPPGQPRLTGADASHAWVSVWCPRLGWVDFDPTNAVLPDTQHIVLGWGRDFGDVSPLRGVILGGGVHAPRVAVTVEPLA